MVIQRILWIELLGGIGDLVIALPAIHAVSRSYPAAQLTVLTFAPGNQLIASDPCIHRIICAERGKARQSVDSLLTAESFDLIISDTNYDGIADAIQHYQALQSSPLQVVTNLWRSPPDQEPVGQRFLNILLAESVIASAVLSQPSQIHLTETEKANARHQLGALYRPLVFLCTDAGMAIKRWPTEQFILLARTLQQRYRATIMVPAGQHPAEAEQLVAELGGTAQVWQRGSLRALAAVLTEANLVISADTGVAHIAAALHIPTITLFGPSWAGRYGHPAPHINLQGFPDCPERRISNFTEQRCWYSGECPYDWKTCLEDISSDVVLEAASAFLKPFINYSIQYHNSVSKYVPLTVPLDSSWQSVCNLLVMRLDNIGDVIMTSPALKALRHSLPSAQITLMASPSGALVAPLLPWIDQVLDWRVLWQDLGKLAFDPAREWKLIETLKAHQFDAALIFTSFSQSPHPAGLACALAGIPLRLGESKEQDFGTLTHAIPAAPDTIHQTERNLRLVESVGFQVDDRQLTLDIPAQVYQIIAQKLLGSTHDATRFDQTSIPPYILLNPWTSCSSRNYPPDRFAEAARILSERTGYRVVMTGVDKDRDRAQTLLKILGNCAIDLIGKTSLSELAALIATARLVLTNNTSVMHIADATQTPTVVLFAGTEQVSQWQPRRASNRILCRSTICQPCYSMTCPYQLQCLEIDPAEVVAAGLELLQAENDR